MALLNNLGLVFLVEWGRMTTTRTRALLVGPGAGATWRGLGLGLVLLIFLEKFLLIFVRWRSRSTILH